MKSLYFAIVLPFLFCMNTITAQVPNFNVTDINGNTHDLYSYLNAGKTVYIDFFATWCNPCWNGIKKGDFEKVWNNHGLSGQNGVLPSTSNDVVVLMIECDTLTSDNQIRGIGGSTKGDWTQYATFPIINLAPSSTVKKDFNVIGYPSYRMICPNKASYLIPQNTTYPSLYTTLIPQNCGINVSTEFADNDNDPFYFEVYPNPLNKGKALTIHSSLEINNPYSIIIHNVIGELITKEKNTTHSSNQNFSMDVSGLPSGVYFISFESANIVRTQRLVISDN